MKIENYGVQEMSSKEIKQVNGGGPWWGALAKGALWVGGVIASGLLYDMISNPDEVRAIAEDEWNKYYDDKNAN